MKEQSNDEDMKIEEIQKRFKDIIFQMFSIYVSHATRISNRVYYLLILVETLQILLFSIHPALSFYTSAIFLPEFRQCTYFLIIVLSYLNFEGHIRSDPSLMTFMVILSFSIVLVHIVCLVASGIILMRKSRGECKKTLHKIVCYQFVIINSILTVPIFNISLICLYCDNGSQYYEDSFQCYNMEHIILCILSVICILTIVI